MATKKTRIVRSNQPETKQLVVQQMVQISVDRTMKDVATLRSALISAESVYYPNRTRLYDLYADVDLDGHLTGIVAKRIAAVRNKKWCFRANDKDVDAVNKFIRTNTFRDIQKGIMESIMWGVSGFEFVPGKNIAFKPIPRKHIKPEKNIITINQSDQEGIDYTSLSNVFVVGDEKDYGLFLKCAFYALIKKGDFGDWAQYVEIFGQPMRVAKYDAYDLKTKSELTDALENAGSSLAMMIPKQADFELLDGKVSNGDGQLQERLKNACNNEMSVIILGNTETTSNDNGGSNAKAKEQGKQQLEITTDDIFFVRNILNSEKFLAILQSYGLPVQGGEFIVEEEPDVNNLSIRKDIDVAISKIVPVEDDYFYNTYNIPKPANYEQLKKDMQAQQMQQQQQQQQQQQRQNKKPTQQTKPENNLTAWQKLRVQLADFFDRARKD